MSAMQVTMVGGGMIAHDQILPSLYHLQRRGRIGEIHICAQHARTLRGLAEAPVFAKAFPGQKFVPHPDWNSESADLPQPDLYRDVVASMAPGHLVIVALPDQLHFDAVMHALECGQHVLCVKPLVLTAWQSIEIEAAARRRGLLVGIEYHKRLDDRSLMARRRYRAGLFGEFKLGTACLLEKWYYRESNFQNWCTAGNSDAFTYIGCHYVDLVAFITGLLPVEVSVYGLRDQYPNGNEGFLWTDARVIWENGACLNVQNALGFPDAAPGSNTQGLTMYCASREKGAWLAHSDQYRGLQYCYVEQPGGQGSTMYAEPSPDYFQYVDLGGPGLNPVGYGYRSVEFIIEAALRVREAGDLAARLRILDEFDAAGVLATPANSRYNELVVEAGRASILNGGRPVRIEYQPAPSVRAIT